MQPVAKQMTREDKEKKVEEFKEWINEYPVVGILDMQNLPAKQLQQMKGDIKEFAKIKMSRKTLMDIALDQSDREDIEDLQDNNSTQPAFIFSERDPFRLYRLIQENKTSAAADGGEIAPNDIVIPEGDTGIGPGPMLGKFQSHGINVQVEDGTLHVQQEGTLVEKGEEITDEHAEILNQMGIEPLEIGLDLDIVYSEGDIFDAEDLDIDPDEYFNDFESGAGLAFNLAVNAGIVNETTADAVIGQASNKAENLATNAGLPEEETIEKSISLASSKAESLDQQIDE